MKKLIVVLLTLSLVLTFAACGCKHQWTEANCQAPKTCSECGETEGEIGDHNWVDATCEEPKTCSLCAVTEGEALGHTWVDATTEAPKTCTVCSKTEGEKIDTDPRFTTAATKDLQGIWEADVQLTAKDLGFEELGIPMEFDSIACHVTYELGNDGAMKTSLEFEDPDALIDLIIEMTVEATYIASEEMGVSRKQADEEMKTAYGMTVREFVEAMYADLSAKDLEDSMAEEGVYYVEDGQFYMGIDWDDEFASHNYTLTDDILTIDSLVGPDGTPYALTRAES